MKLEAGSEDQEEQTGLVVDLVTLCTENVCLSVGSNLELSMIHKDYQVKYISNKKPYIAAGIALHSCSQIVVSHEDTI